MQSAQYNAAIQIPRGRPHGHAGTTPQSDSSRLSMYPPLGNASYTPVGDLALEDDLFDLFTIDDLQTDSFGSPPPAQQGFSGHHWTQAYGPALQAHPHHEISPSTWSFQTQTQDQSAWSPQPSSYVACAAQYIGFDDHGYPSPSNTFLTHGGNYPNRTSTAGEQPWNSYSEKLSVNVHRMERVPSLDYDGSRNSLEFESPPEAAAIFGAAHWSDFVPSESASRIHAPKWNGDMTLDVQQETESQSWGLESINGSGREPILNESRIHAQEQFQHESHAMMVSAGVPFDGQSALFTDSASSRHGSSYPHDMSMNVTTGEFMPHEYFQQGESSREGLPPHLMEITEHQQEDPAQTYSTQTVIRVGFEQTLDDTEMLWDCFVLEDGSGRSIIPPAARRKGIRKGPFSAPKKAQIAKVRKEGIVCIKCRVERVACEGGNPCQKCIKQIESASIFYPCIKANFLDIINSGSCNYISQRAINHFTLDRSRRIKMFLAEAFDVNELLDLIDGRRGFFNFRVRQASGNLYVLDLEGCYRYLDGIRRKSESTGQLRSFIDETLVKTGSWYQCVKECDPSVNTTLLLSQWNNMPSRATYSLVPLSSYLPERDLDPEDPSDREEILVAAQLSRIVCRKLEIDGYSALQKEISGMRPSNSLLSRTNAVRNLGKILLSLRWRMSWWKTLGDGSAVQDPFRERFIDRVELLSRGLYFYYFTVLKRIDSWGDTSGLKGEMSSYPDAESVFDDFPKIASIEGFEAWLARGIDLIKEANCERRFGR